MNIVVMQTTDNESAKHKVFFDTLMMQKSDENVEKINFYVSQGTCETSASSGGKKLILGQIFLRVIHPQIIKTGQSLTML